ncbi:hypothetical protein JB92DRAFT_3118611 [Gautieria morchelliformis]|nr:hypothetical protein JB92DRAFT_3118611 [Gautieria morchelliformis]
MYILQFNYHTSSILCKLDLTVIIVFEPSPGDFYLRPEEDLGITEMPSSASSSKKKKAQAQAGMGMSTAELQRCLDEQDSMIKMLVAQNKKKSKSAHVESDDEDENGSSDNDDDNEDYTSSESQAQAQVPFGTAGKKGDGLFGSKGYNLQDHMGLVDDNQRYLDIRATVHDQIAHYRLEGKKRKQDPKDMAAIYLAINEFGIVGKKYPELKDFENSWPIQDMVTGILCNRMDYKKNRTVQCPKKAEQTRARHLALKEARTEREQVEASNKKEVSEERNNHSKEVSKDQENRSKEVGKDQDNDSNHEEITADNQDGEQQQSREEYTNRDADTSDSISESASGSDSISGSAFRNDSASGRTSTSSVRFASSTPISDFHSQNSAGNQATRVIGGIKGRSRVREVRGMQG